MAQENRDSERVRILGELPGAATVIQPVAITELSRGGAQVECAFPLQLNSLHDFRLVLGDRSVIVRARVAHCRVADLASETVLYRAGIEFIDPPAWAAEAIHAFIEELKAGRRA